MKNNTNLVIETHGLSKAYNNVTALKSLDLKMAQYRHQRTMAPTLRSRVLRWIFGRSNMNRAL